MKLKPVLVALLLTVIMGTVASASQIEHTLMKQEAETVIPSLPTVAGNNAVDILNGNGVWNETILNRARTSCSTLTDNCVSKFEKYTRNGHTFGIYYSKNGEALVKHLFPNEKTYLKRDVMKRILSTPHFECNCICLDPSIDCIYVDAFQTKNRCIDGIKRLRISGPTCGLEYVPSYIQILNTNNQVLEHNSCCKCPEKKFSWGTIKPHKNLILEINIEVDTFTQQMLNEVLKSFKGNQCHFGMFWIIKGNVKCIDSDVFKDCKWLSTIELPKSLNIIKQGAFNGCSNLIHIGLPRKVLHIATESFQGCDKLSESAKGKIIGTKPLFDVSFYNGGQEFQLLYFNGERGELIKVKTGQKLILCGNLVKEVLLGITSNSINNFDLNKIYNLESKNDKGKKGKCTKTSADSIFVPIKK